jgi:hypothetical protein
MATGEIARLRFEGELSWKRGLGCYQPAKTDAVPAPLSMQAVRLPSLGHLDI